MSRKQRPTTRRPPTGPRAADFPDLLELVIGPPAHGGHCIARLEGQVVFVRHALPGETVRARVTDAGGGGRYLRADAVEVLAGASERVPAPCAWAGSCGGCDWQHVTPKGQRELKSAVVSEALSRALGRDIHVPVEAVPGDHDGLGWRTRVRLAVGAQGRAGFHPARSRAIVPITSCLIAHPDLGLEQILAQSWQPNSDLTVETDGAGQRVIADAGGLTRSAAGRRWQVPAGGFWQVHPGAPAVLVAAVREFAAVRPGERVIDLYAGVGLFGGVLAGEVGPAGQVEVVESGRIAAATAAANLHDLVQCRVSAARVEDWLAGASAADVVVLDPPRSGAGRVVINEVARLAGRAIVYVACDPVALARDAATLAATGWDLTRVRAFDLFPMTHHMECVAEFGRQSAAAGSNS